MLPWWVTAYFLAYGAFTIVVLRSDIKDKDPLWFVVAGLLADIALIPIALSFWLADLRTTMEPFLLEAFTTGSAVFLGQAIVEFRKNFPDPEFSPKENLVLAVVALTLVVVITGPLLTWGFMSAVLGRGVGV